jgi:hypothetical protein
MRESASLPPTRPIVPHKARFVLDAMEHYAIRSFADLGGSWGVHGGYAYQALLPFPVERAFLVDDFVPPAVAERFVNYPQFDIIKGAFGLKETVEALPQVDALFLFDILLHQVDPNWDAVLELYARKTQHLLVYNQQWVGSAQTVRLTDMTPEHYVTNTPFAAWEDRAKALEAVRGIYAGFGTPHTKFGGKNRRDCPDVWQWGITTPDLVTACYGLGFKLDRMQNYGLFAPELKSFENHGYWFTRR